MKFLTILCLGLFPFAWIQAEDADTMREKGIAALKDSQENPRSIVPAARFFAKASALYSVDKNDDKAVEMNSFLYWCKKKMTMQDIDAFTKEGDEETKTKLATVEQAAPAPTEAQTWLGRVEKFALAHPNEHLLIAIRYYEIADRFRGRDEGLTAMDRSLKEMQLTGTKSTLPPIRATLTAKPSTNGRKEVPDGSLLKEANKLIHETLKAEFASTKPEDKEVLVKKLLEIATGSPAGSAEKYEALRETFEEAVASGCSTIAVNVADVLHQEFAVDGNSDAAQLQFISAHSRIDESGLFAATMVALHSAARSIDAEQYDELRTLVTVSQTLVSKLPKRTYTQMLTAEVNRIAQILKEWPVCETALKKLIKDPADPAANSTAGRFYCFVQESWERGIPQLAHGSDVGMKAAAEKELEAPATSAAQQALADAWYDLAKKLPVQLQRAAYVHAGLWYDRALSAASGLDKLKIEKRIAEIRNGDPSPLIPPVIVLTATYGKEDKKSDVTAHYQKAFNTDPFAVVYGSELFPKGATDGGGRVINFRFLIDGHIESSSIADTGFYVPHYFERGVKTSNPGFKLLRARVSAPVAWLDCTDLAVAALKNEDATIRSKDVYEQGKPRDPWPYAGKNMIVWYELGGKRYAKVFGSDDTVKFK